MPGTDPRARDRHPCWGQTRCAGDRPPCRGQTPALGTDTRAGDRPPRWGQTPVPGTDPRAGAGQRQGRPRLSLERAAVSAAGAATSSEAGARPCPSSHIRPPARQSQRDALGRLRAHGLPFSTARAAAWVQTGVQSSDTRCWGRYKSALFEFRGNGCTTSPHRHRARPLCLPLPAPQSVPDRQTRPAPFVVRVMCSVLGLFVRQSDPRLRDSSARVYIANHVTQFDHNVVSLLTSCSTPALNAAPGFLCWSRGFLELGAGSRVELVHSLKAYSSHGANPPLLLFPEEAATNGRAGLLRFSSWPFSLADVVQPVALHVQTWAPVLRGSVADSSWITELLWTFFAPFTVYQVRWLPSVPRRAEEPSEDFALRVQELLAVELGVVSTRLTAADKAEHMKRLRHTSLLPFAPGSSQPLAARPRGPSGRGTAEDVRITAMAQRVKEVLPHVPLEVIETDLARTSCVDTTIANLLEGSVPFCPEGGEDSADLPAPAPSPPAAAAGTPAPKQFAKSPVERHLSLQERKRALYDYARR
ncbi:ancient ubiquitous protein 1 [Columba livia]|uniref:Lipid droplet-regulating VLDL assembly factor AUP1 n=1 Tax=Columba livia TaxID=8932 RepID=A0A2I0LJM9_COLLI|nr:ancient ubiquitous protein 1 [Columba livia]